MWLITDAWNHGWRVLAFAAAGWVIAGAAAAQSEPTANGAAGDASTSRPPAESTGAARERASRPEGFERAASSVDRRVREAAAELAALRERIADEKIPLSRELRALEQELAEVRETFQQKQRLLDTRRLDITNLKKQIEARKNEAGYLSDLFGQYVRNFESRLHIAELQRYEGAIEAAKLAPDKASLSRGEKLKEQLAALRVSFGRLEEAMGGARFEGSAVDPGGRVKPGVFALVGPAAVFRSKDGDVVGVAQQRLGSLEPTIVPFEDPAAAGAASALVERGEGEWPLDPTLGNAVKIQATEDTLWQHVQKGGPVMVPIFALAGASLLVGLLKWISLMLVRMPRRRRIDELMQAVAGGRESEAKEAADRMRGPVGQMLQVGVEHLREPRELVEEAMYEKVLATRIRLQRLLPFIAITAASAPLLGLLGTVTGIINTFELITVFGTGDVQTLSGGISEALITTKFGLIVAVPTLLLHAFLSRKAKGVVDQMEKSAVALANQVSHYRHQAGLSDAAAAGADADPAADADSGTESESDSGSGSESDAESDARPEPEVEASAQPAPHASAVEYSQ